MQDSQCDLSVLVCQTTAVFSAHIVQIFKLLWMSLHQRDHSATILPRTKEKAKHYQTPRDAKITEGRNGYISELTA